MNGSNLAAEAGAPGWLAAWDLLRAAHPDWRYAVVIGAHLTEADARDLADRAKRAQVSDYIAIKRFQGQ